MNTQKAIHTKDNNYKNNYNDTTLAPAHANLLLISMSCSFVICRFKCFRSGPGWLVVFVIYQIKKCSECESCNIVLLCRYCYSWGVNFPISIELESCLKLYSYSFISVNLVSLKYYYRF